MEEFVSRSPEETRAIGRRIAAALTPGRVLALEGDLGAGKTCLTEGIARGLGFTGEVNSPTFALVNEYRGGRLDLFHFDMYRVTGWEDLYSTGFFDYLEEAADPAAGGALAVEWSENIAAALPDHTVTVSVLAQPDGSRKITVEGMEI